jgi:hypothetical protein
MPTNKHFYVIRVPYIVASHLKILIPVGRVIIKTAGHASKSASFFNRQGN